MYEGSQSPANADRDRGLGAAEYVNTPPFWQVSDGQGGRIDEISAFLLDFWALGNAESSCRSYAFDLLRWYRHMWSHSVVWDRARRDDVRDFVVACRDVSSDRGRPLAPRTINHNLAVISEFYSFHSRNHRGPLLNPVPARGHRASPAPDGRQDRAEGQYLKRADFRQKVPTASSRALSEPQIVKLFDAVQHPRDRALLSFYLSSAARPSELLGIRIDDLDLGNQRITVTRKGSRARQALPAAPGAFVWLRMYQETLPPELLQPGSPVWWTLRKPLRPLNYEATRAMLRRAGAVVGAAPKLHDFRHTAASEMSKDAALSLVDIQRILGHVHLSTTQRYVAQHDDDVLQRVAEHLIQREQPKLAVTDVARLPYAGEDLRELIGDSW